MYISGYLYGTFSRALTLLSMTYLEKWDLNIGNISSSICDEIELISTRQTTLCLLRHNYGSAGPTGLHGSMNVVTIDKGDVEQECLMYQRLEQASKLLPCQEF